MILVLAEPGDPVAAWAATGLASRGRTVCAFSASDLAGASTWVHEVDSSSARVRAAWDDGRRLDGEQVAATFNRLAADPPPPAGVAAADRAYAAEERRAFTLAWLASLPGPMLNRVVPEGWSGAEPGPVAVHVLAAAAGLPVDDADEGDTDHRPVQRALVVGDAVLGPPLAQRWAERCRALAGAVGLGVAGIDFVPSARADGWVVRRVDPRPDLRRGGTAALDALDRALAVAS